MWPFTKKRADPIPAQKVDESTFDALLRAGLSDDYMTKEKAMNVPAFAACVNKISETVSTIPIRLYMHLDGEKVEAVEDPRVRLLNDDTGDTLNGVEFKRAMIRDYLIGKGGYAYIRRNGTSVQSIHYVEEEYISFQFSSDPIFKDYDILVNGRSYRPFEFIKVLRNTRNGRDGKSVIDENNEVISVAYNSLCFEKTLVKTGGNKKGFVKSVHKLSKDAIDALKAAWKNLYQNNTESVVILNDGLDFKESSNTSVEMQLNENKKTNGDEICKIFGMPPSMVNGKSTQEPDESNFIQYCLNPVLDEFVCALNRDLLLETEKDSYFFAADTSELTKGDIEKRYRAYEIAGRNGFMQIDEIRRKENLPPLNLNFVRLGLQDVFYDPITSQFFIPNMNQSGGLGMGKGEKVDEN